MKYLLVFLIGSLSFPCLAQVDNVGSGRALYFDGIDDVIEFPNYYDDLKLPFTISAWVYIDPSAATVGPIFVSQDNQDIYNGFWFFASKQSIIFEYGDGKGGNNPAFRKGKIALLDNMTSRWIHVCGVMKSPTDINLYVNGVDVGGYSSGSSFNSMDSNAPLDIPKIGYMLSNGIEYRFKGLIDEVRFYNQALTETEIRATMCHKLKGDEPGLIGYWNFDETSGNEVHDKSPSNLTGQLLGGVQRQFSGAPIGDVSVYRYSQTWSGSVLSLSQENKRIDAYNLLGNPEGIHLYSVNSMPSLTGNLNNPGAPYFGAFLASTDVDNWFSLDFSFNNSISVCKTFVRNNNSVTHWNDQAIPIKNIYERIEFIDDATVFPIFDLGSNRVFCDVKSFIISPGIDPTNETFLWNNGQTTPELTVTNSGLYKLTISNSCISLSDSIFIKFSETPQIFSLGPDILKCESQSVTLKPDISFNDYESIWSTGAKQESIDVILEGTYWLEVKNECGSQKDSVNISNIDFSDIEFPNIITPNGDTKNQAFILDTRLEKPTLQIFNRWGMNVYQSTEYDNSWDGGDLSDGVYYYHVINQCNEIIKGAITLKR